MGKEERKIMRALGLARKKEEVHIFRDSIIGKTWYFEKPLEKIILILSLIALFYSIARIIFQGWW